MPDPRPSDRVWIQSRFYPPGEDPAVSEQRLEDTAWAIVEPYLHDRPLAGLFTPIIRPFVDHVSHWFPDLYAAVETGVSPLLVDVFAYIRRSERVLARANEDLDAIVERNPGVPVVAIGESFGGVVLVDALSSRVKTGHLPGLRLFVTVGSQSSYLLSCDAMEEIRRGDPHPPAFVPWLNVWNRMDLLSFPVRPILGDPFPYERQLRDVELTDDLPFPAIHTLYFSRPGTFDAIVATLADLEAIGFLASPAEPMPPITLLEDGAPASDASPAA
jgi:hypothetical protein